MNHTPRLILRVCLFFSLILLPVPASATPELGVRFPAFKLQALDDNFYGTEGAEGKVSVLYFLGYNCAPCVGAGPALESLMWHKIREISGVQMMGLDLWNGSIPQLRGYQSITGITFPLLKQANLNRPDYAGAGLSDLVVVDQEGYVRLVINGEGLNDYPRVLEMIASLQSKTPIVKMITKTLYYGRAMQVGQTGTQEMTLSNSGAGPLEIAGIQTDIPGVTMDPPTFTLAPYETRTTRVTFSPTLAGTFSGDVRLVHNDKGVPTLKIEFVEIVVEGRAFASISLAQTSLDFGNSDLDKAVQKTITLSNAGPGILTVSDIQSDLNGLAISERQFSIPAKGSKEIRIGFQAKTTGPFSGVLTVLSDDPDRAALTIPFSGMGVFMPADARTDFDGSGKVEFADFVAFVQNFGGENTLFDLDGSGRVDFADFLTFAQSFGKSVSLANSN
jgi:hypothetical protein